MPGIAGIIGSGCQQENALIMRQMTSCMMHEPCYGSRTYADGHLGLWSGWVGHRESFSDCMPVWNEGRDICLMFTGEEFTDISEIERLKSHGHEFDPENASYLIHLYEELGPGFLERLNGWFSGVLADTRAQKIILFNDRYGMGRVYVHEGARGLYFASEAKSILRVLPELRRLDPAGLAETFSCGCVLQNRTLFPGVALLPPGSAWTLTGRHDISRRVYFTPAQWEQQQPLSSESYNEELKNAFARVLPRYFRGKRRMAMSLTGGLDGRMIMSWAPRAPGEFPCYTFGSPYRECSDVRIAREIAKRCRQSHEAIVVGDSFIAEFPALAEKSVLISDGTMDVSGAVELYANRIARRIAPVRMTGNYGSEILRGSISFRPDLPEPELLTPDFARLVRAAAVTYGYERQVPALSFIAFKQVPWHHYKRLSLEQSQLTPRSPYLDNDLVSLVYRATPELIASKAPSFRLIAAGNAALSRIPTDRSLLLRPIPVLTPLRHLASELSFKAEHGFDYGMPHWMSRLDRFFAPLHLERLFLGRHKFYHFRTLYRDRLAQYVRDILLDPRTLTRPYLNGRALEKMVLDHTRGRCNHTVEIHRVLTTELIERILIEPNGSHVVDR